MGNFGGGLRQLGVQGGGSLNDRRAPVKTVTHMVEMRTFAVELGDETGEKHTTILFKIGDMWYNDPNGEPWAQRLRPIDKNSWLAKALNINLAAAKAENSASVPKEDAVDILEGGK